MAQIPPSAGRRQQQPRARQRPSTAFGPIALPPALDPPTVSTSDGARIHKHEPTGERPITQNLGPNATTYSVSGTAFLSHANSIDRLVRGGPFRFRHDSVMGDATDGAAWVFCKSTSTTPMQWQPERGQWGYQYDLELIESRPPGNDNPRIPLGINAPGTANRPTARPSRSARLGPIELPPAFSKPAVSVDTKARIKEHEPLNQPSIVRHQGYDSRELTIEGPCFRNHLRPLRRLSRGDRIEVRTDRFVGEAAVKTVDTDDTKRRYNRGQWGRSYTVQLIESLE